MAFTRLYDAAHISGVCDQALSRMSTGAPLSRMAATVSESPLAAAKCSAVAPPEVVANFTSAPAASNALADPPRPALAARCKGV